MKLKKFIAKKVHGYLQFDINFFDQTTFLIGINGSGKTSALKLILGLISPSWMNLNRIGFEHASLTCVTAEGREIIIAANAVDENKVELSVTEQGITDSHRFTRIEIPFFDLSASRFESRTLLTSIARQESRFHQNPVVRKIEELNTPIFLGLDRRIYEGREIDFLNIDNLAREQNVTEPLKGNLFNSLKDVERLIFDNFFLFTQGQSAINEELKNQIIHTSFELLNESQLEFNLQTTVIDFKEKKEQVSKAASKINVPGIIEQLNKFFDDLEEIQSVINMKKPKKRSQEMELAEVKAVQKWFINVPQLQRIDKIIKLYQKSEQDIQTEYLPFKNLENLANKFFSESGKKLVIGLNGEMIIQLPDSSPGNIFRLSSGEQQILVMLAQLIFSENKKKGGSIFIIDEPELSLHLEWQEIFVRALREASPNTQLILATHSPTIIGEVNNQRYCQDLSRLNIN